ncbi:hypothetical protein J6590_062845 [Homalodisca vitripennis]|nr:hypothetical protein J6590_062845 [Homalodisca vitripennis]
MSTKVSPGESGDMTTILKVNSTLRPRTFYHRPCTIIFRFRYDNNHLKHGKAENRACTLHVPVHVILISEILNPLDLASDTLYLISQHPSSLPLFSLPVFDMVDVVLSPKYGPLVNLNHGACRYIAFYSAYILLQARLFVQFVDESWRVIIYPFRRGRRPSSILGQVTSRLIYSKRHNASPVRRDVCTAYNHYGSYLLSHFQSAFRLSAPSTKSIYSSAT